MRILYVCADPGIDLTGTKGASTHVRSLVRAFTAIGHDVSVLATCAGGANLDVSVIEIPVPDIADELAAHAEPRLARALRHVWTNVAVERAMQDVWPSFAPELVYERYSPFSVAGSLVARQRETSHVLEVNAPLAWEGKTYRRQALQQAAEALEMAAWTTTECIVAVSEQLKTILVDEGVDGSKIVVVPNGVDTERFTPAGDVWGDRRHGEIVIGFVGSLKPWHGIDLLGEAFRVLADDPRLHLLIVGDGPEAHVLASLEEAYPDRVTHVPGARHEEIPSYLRAIDIAVAPYSRLDRFYYSPLKILEYMATGRAIVAGEIGQVGTLIDHGRTGLLVAPGDVDQLAAAIRRLADNNLLRRTLGAAAADDAVAHHQWVHRATHIAGLTKAVA